MLNESVWDLIASRKDIDQRECFAEIRACSNLRNIFSISEMEYISLIFILLIGVLGVILWIRVNLCRPRNFPPGPQWLPFVGNSPQIRREGRKLGGLHRVYEEWTKEYRSKVLGMKLGGNFYVVGSSYDIVREIHMREEFEGRPKNFFMRLRTMGSLRGITCVDGAMWAEHRAFAVKHLRNAGYGRQPMELMIAEEMDDLIKLIDSLREAEGTFWPGKYLPVSVLNVLWTFTAGRRLGRDDERIEKLLQLLQQRSKAFDMSGGVLSSMPWIRFFAPEWSGYNLIRRFNEELKNLLMETIERHHATYTEEKSSDDLIYAFIKEMKMQEDNDKTTFSDIQLTMVILDIFIAGSQTTSTTIDLALMALLLYPAMQEKIYREICENGRKSHGNLPFTEAYLMEVRRFFNVVPISGPRRATRETNLGGYRVPKDVTILINLHSVHMDEDFWGDPQVFRPERFLDDTGKICNVERLMPFGQGKRRCLGDTLARACIFTFFTGIVEKFKLSTGPQDEHPDVNLLPGITLSPKPYKVLFEKR
ncbi:probable cytochrome P450 305a1 [Phlebotomus papatasi]|uniref:probable cytochrome P450 305a1 n=1 Tax=Phlebotomus papatasi TaxID=29031 RepID=UPI002483CBF7|nr:probable cytochrome P450 305a1 [Phlebotomus papatasi]